MAKTSNGWTPLSCAAESGDEIRCLVKKFHLVRKSVKVYITMYQKLDVL